MKRKNVHLSDRQLEKLTKLTKITDIKMAEHIRRAIDEYLEKYKELVDANNKNT